MAFDALSRRHLLCLCGASAAAGCSLVEIESTHRQRLEDLVRTDLGGFPHGVTVTDAHLRHRRRTFRDVRDELQHTIDAVTERQRARFDNRTLSAASFQDTLETAASFRHEWDVVNYLRASTVGAVARRAVIRFRTDELSLATLEERTARLIDRLDSAYSLLEYDRGGFDRGLVQLAFAEEQLDQAIRRRRIHEDVSTADAPDVDADFVYNIVRNIAVARAILADVEFLVEALPTAETHVPRFAALYRRLYPIARDRLRDDGSEDSYAGIDWVELTHSSGPRTLLADEQYLSTARARTYGYHASTVLVTLDALVMDAAADALSEAVSTQQLDQFPLRRMAETGARANDAFSTAAENADSLVDVVLLDRARTPLSGANGAIERDLESDSREPERRKTAYLQYVAAEAISEAVTRWTDRLDRINRQLGTPTPQTG